MISKELEQEIVSVLTNLKEDAEMALDGRWDCTTTEGKETGFIPQIILINDLLNKITNETNDKKSG
tara:strand:+ start:34924 stop:35121 length:198 start_codon:yes stop_codon:yes gene_type:complete